MTEVPRSVLAARAPGGPSAPATAEAPIVVLASGLRCGSTLVQRLLNSHPDALLWGEQDGFLNRFVPEHRRLLAWQAEYHAQRDEYLARGYDTFSANLLPTGRELTTAAAGYLRALFADPARTLGKRRWGFKEVRCGAAIAVFLRELFPPARIVHLTRDPVDCFLSLKEWEESPDPWDRAATEGVLADWARINASFLPGAADGPPAHLSLRYEDLLAGREEQVGRLAAFVGLDPAKLDLGVFGNRLHREGEEGRAARRLAARNALSRDERALLCREPLPAVAAAYGYEIGFG